MGLSSSVIYSAPISWGQVLTSLSITPVSDAVRLIPLLCHLEAPVQSVRTRKQNEAVNTGHFLL